MFDELTEIDIKKMKEELEYRITKLRPEILEEVKLTRSYGDLSENAEYKNLPFRQVLAISPLRSVLLVKLHLPLPVIIIFLAGRGIFSKTKTFLP